MFGTLAELERAETSQSDRSSVALVTPARVSATWMPMTSELGAPAPRPAPAPAARPRPRAARAAPAPPRPRGGGPRPRPPPRPPPPPPPPRLFARRRPPPPGPPPPFLDRPSRWLRGRFRSRKP